MIRTALALLLSALLAQAAHADERVFAIGSFDRVRVEGPFRVVVTLNQSPGARAVGDERATDMVDVRVEGGTLIVRAGMNGWAEQGRNRGGGAPVIRASTLAIRAVALVGGGDLTIEGPFRSQRIDLSLTGSGSLRASTIETDQMNAVVLGSGAMTLGGMAGRARLATSGSAVISAAALDARDLTVRLDGSGAITARARFSAAITATGAGAVTVYGKPACTVSPNSAGPVLCGAPDPPPAP